MKSRAGVSDHADDDIVTNPGLRERDDIPVRHQRERIPHRRTFPVAIPRIFRHAPRGHEGQHKDRKSRCCSFHFPSLLPAGDQADEDRTPMTFHGLARRQENCGCTETCEFGWGVMVVKRNPYSSIYLTTEATNKCPVPTMAFPVRRERRHPGLICHNSRTSIYFRVTGPHWREMPFPLNASTAK